MDNVRLVRVIYTVDVRKHTDRFMHVHVLQFPDIHLARIDFCVNSVGWTKFLEMRDKV